MRENTPHPYILSERNRRSALQRTVEEVIYDIKLDDRYDNRKLADILPHLDNVFRDVLRDVRPSTARDTDLVRIYLQHPDLRVPITIPLRPWSDLKVRDVMDKIEHVLTSKESLRVQEGFNIHVGTIEVPDGGGRSKVVHVTGENSCLKRKKSVVTIQNTDNLCLARSIVVALAKLHGDPLYDSIRKPRMEQRIRAQELQQQAGMPADTVCGLNDIQKFEDVIDTQVVVISATRGNKPIYVGRHRNKRVYLYHTVNDKREGHFDTITSITGMSMD